MAEEKEKETEEESEEEEAKPDLIKQANEAAERIEKANAATQAALDRQERLIAENRLGGEADAGSPPRTQQDKDIEDAKSLLSGTGLDPFAGEGKNALSQKEV